MAAPDIVLGLIERIRRNLPLYSATGYDEIQFRSEFIDRFFEALGWDVDNKAGASPVYQEVVRHYGTEVEGLKKTADYAFRVGERVKFFVEAKRPGVRLKNDPGPAYQLREYAYSQQLPLSVLTDFEEFAVYDGRVKPSKKDLAAKARVMYLTYEEYNDRWKEIKAIFSRDAIWQGAFDKFAEENRGGKHEPLNKSFLNMLNKWREDLARNVANRNRNLGLDKHELTWVVQMVLDRLIFLRVAEDRNIEESGRLSNIADGEGVYSNLIKIFYEADDRYNSGLFHFLEEKGRSTKPDELTPKIRIDDMVLRRIIKELYDSPFNFALVPVEILGQAYEQFLGKTIRLTETGVVKFDEKPGYRKGEGVYYTPQYIVDYIVENTVSKLLKKCSRPSDAAKLRILDPACGSGSFLLGAYQRLLDWHLDWYFKDGHEKHRKKLVPDGTSWRLNINEKKRILKNNIYGVDIDEQAVEVTKLSLLLKAIEGESRESVGAQLKLYKERALPDLGHNIKCGNSLIGPDFYEGKQMSLLSDEERLRINPFDWEAEFGEIMEPRPAYGGAKAGFDAVIGNPPWGSKEVLKEDEINYFEKKMGIKRMNLNIFAVFLTLSCEKIVKRKGVVGLLIPKNYIKTSAYHENRRNILMNYFINCITDHGKFPGVAQEAVSIYISDESKSDYKINRLSFRDGVLEDIGFLTKKVVMKEPENIISLTLDMNFVCIFNKIDKISISLGDICKVGRGMEHGRTGNIIKCKNCKLWFEKPGKASIYKPEYVCHHCRNESPRSRYLEKVFIHKIERCSLSENISPLLVGNDIDRYVHKSTKYVVEKDIPGIDYKSELHLGDKIYFIRISKNLRGNIDRDNTQSLNALNIVKVRNGHKYALEYILGILNSSLINIYFEQRYTSGADLTVRISNKIMRNLPIRTIDFDDPEDVKMHDRMVSLVEDMLELHKKLAKAKTPPTQKSIKRQIDATDRQIDNLVYELYGLTEEEIRVVEGEIG